MYYYKRVVQSGDMLEVEYYKSIRKRGKPASRSCNKSASTEQQKARNEITAKKKCQRLIATNFTTDDLYITLTFRDNITQDKANNEVTNFVRRLKRYRNKHNLAPLKYIGCIECGKRRNRFHAHFVITGTSIEVITALWKCGRVKIEKLYQDGNFADLAQYISKDVTGQRRLKQSKNLIPPVETVTEMNKKEIRAIENGIVPKFDSRIDNEYDMQTYQSETRYNDIMGISASFVFTRREKLKKPAKHKPLHINTAAAEYIPPYRLLSTN